MDDEDLADAEEARKIQTAQSFAGLGGNGVQDDNGASAGGLAGLLRVQGETMGSKLLKKMGWREGQGIGPKVRRRADLGMSTEDATYHLFAPDNVIMVGFIRKVDRKGLGFAGEAKLTPLASSRSREVSRSDDEDGEEDGVLNLGRPKFSISGSGKKKDTSKARGGIGMGVLNDTGSDDEDPYEMGPRISYNKVIGPGKAKKKKKDSGSTTTVNPLLKSKPVFLPKKTTLGQTALSTRKCHDGRPPLDGFVFGQQPDPLISMINADGKHPPPEIPPDWKSSKSPEATGKAPQYVSTADAAKATQLNPAARAALLGEKQLPGKSVFDFLSPAARNRLAAVTGKADLPQAKGEIPEGYALSEDEKKRSLLERIPKLDKQSAIGAMARGASGSGPYGDNEDKRARYRSYLELQAGLRSEPAERPSKMSTDEWMQEMDEFYNVARIFRPVTGSMASRFTTASSSTMTTGSDGKAGDAGLVSKPAAKPEDPAEAAAKMGMFGTMTRSVSEFYPTRLLCKRFNVKPPAHVQGDGDASRKQASRHYPEPAPMNQEIWDAPEATGGSGDVPAGRGVAQTGKKQEENVVDAERNEALEGERAGEEVFKAIFGDSSDDES